MGCRGDGVVPHEEGFLASCSCGAVCKDAEACECQEDAALTEEEDGKTFAYGPGVCSSAPSSGVRVLTLTSAEIVQV